MSRRPSLKEIRGFCGIVAVKWIRAHIIQRVVRMFAMMALTVAVFLVPIPSTISRCIRISTLVRLRPLLSSTPLALTITTSTVALLWCGHVIHRHSTLLLLLLHHHTGHRVLLHQLEHALLTLLFLLLLELLVSLLLLALALLDFVYFASRSSGVSILVLQTVR